MPDIKPFRGILYNPKKVDLTSVVAPPYDVISPQLQSELYARDEHNIIRLILNREEDRYGSASHIFEQWRGENILAMDPGPAIYVLSQSYSLPDGSAAERRGFIAACRLEEIGKGSILPHEKTHSKPKEDRLRLFQATNAMFSQIFGLYSDRQLKLNAYLDPVTTDKPAIDVVHEGVRNRLWRLSEERALFGLADYIAHQKILIADGHHRYETALAYRDACRFQNPQHTGKEPYNFLPMFFANMDDPGLEIFPTHRILHSLKNFRPKQFLKDLGEYFTVERADSSEEMLRLLQQQTSHAFGLAVAGDKQFYFLRLAPGRNMREFSPEPEIILQLDVSVLHLIVCKKILGLTDAQQEQKLNLDYEKESRRALERVQEGEAQAAFIMNPTRIEQVRAVATTGLVMPQKSTYFYPKLLSGLVTYSFRRE